MLPLLLDEDDEELLDVRGCDELLLLLLLPEEELLPPLKISRNTLPLELLVLPLLLLLL